MAVRFLPHNNQHVFSSRNQNAFSRQLISEFYYYPLSLSYH